MMHPPPLLPPQTDWQTRAEPDNQAQRSSDSARLRLSAYDPRAVGGRQTVRLSLAKDFALGLDNLELRVRCDLLPMKTSQYRFVRALSGEWQSVLLSFSSRNKEHGQYPLEMELRFHHEQTCVKRWLCSTVLLLPRSDASLSEIHQVFLASQKNVRVIAENGAIAKLHHEQLSSAQDRQLNLEVIARDASIAQVALPSQRENTHRDVAPGYLAWDEVLVEVAAQAITQEQALQKEYQQKSQATVSTVVDTKPVISNAASVETAAPIDRPDKLSRAFYHPIRHHWLRILVGNTWRIGRVIENEIGHQTSLPEIQIAHPRISASHATLQLRKEGMELIDHSRYGMLVNGERIAPLHPVRLHIGDRIDLCASFAGTLVWQVIAFDQRMLILQHSTEHGNFDTVCLVFQEPGKACLQLEDIYSHLKRIQMQTQARGIPDFENATIAENAAVWRSFEQSYPGQT